MRAILTWHSLDASASPISVTPARFREQLRGIAEAGMKVVSVHELLTLPDDARAVALTFDDGFANFVTAALPALRERNWPATLFVVTERVGRDNAWRGPRRGIPTLPLLTWEELGALGADGVELGTHTRTHPDLRGLGAAELSDEIVGARAEIAKRTGKVPTGLAYPYGAFDDAAAAAVRSTHRWGVTTEFRELRAGDDDAFLPRLDAWYFASAQSFAGWGGARFRAWTSLRRVARGVRRAFGPSRHQ